MHQLGELCMALAALDDAAGRRAAWPEAGPAVSVLGSDALAAGSSLGCFGDGGSKGKASSTRERFAGDCAIGTLAMVLGRDGCPDLMAMADQRGDRRGVGCRSTFTASGAARGEAATVGLTVAAAPCWPKAELLASETTTDPAS